MKSKEVSAIFFYDDTSPEGNPAVAHTHEGASPPLPWGGGGVLSKAADDWRRAQQGWRGVPGGGWRAEIVEECEHVVVYAYG